MPKIDKKPEPVVAPAPTASPAAPAPSVHPTIGRIVLYKLSEADLKEITEHIGWKHASIARAGEIVPMIVTRVFNAGCVNGQLLVDGQGTLWRSSVTFGEKNGEWAWPTRS